MFAARKIAVCVALGALLVALLLAGSAQCEQLSPRDGSNALDEQRELVADQQAASLLARHNNRLLAVPHSLARFLFHNARQGADHETSAQLTASPAAGYKRSSSALDALTGVTLGKRSTNALELVNLDPMLGRQPFVRTPARLYGTRWAPYEATYEPSYKSLDY